MPLVDPLPAEDNHEFLEIEAASARTPPWH